MTQRTFTLHVRLLADFDRGVLDWLGEQVQGANEAFAPAAFSFEKVEPQKMPFRGSVVHLDRCEMNMEGSSEQVELFNSVADVPREAIVVFVATHFEPWNGGGCAWHPPQRLGCIVTPGSWRYKLAHELGHVLGLPHASRSTRLMYASPGNGTPPILNADEVNALRTGQTDRLPASDPSLGLTEKSLKFELERIEPDFSHLTRYGSKGLSIVRELYADAKRNPELRRRALYAMSLLSDTAPRALLAAALCEDPDMRRTAASALANHLPSRVAQDRLWNLVRDDDLTVRHVAAFHVPLPSRGKAMVSPNRNKQSSKISARSRSDKADKEKLPITIPLHPTDKCVFRYCLSDTDAQVLVCLKGPGKNTRRNFKVRNGKPLSRLINGLQGGQPYLLSWSFQDARLEWKSRAEFFVNGDCRFRHLKSSDGKDPVNRGFLVLKVSGARKKPSQKRNHTN